MCGSTKTIAAKELRAPAVDRDQIVLKVAQVKCCRNVVEDRLKAGLTCVFLGIAMVFTVGLSQIDTVHNAAHDTRHAIGFPCH